MTTPSGTELTDAQLNVKVAEVMGWKWVEGVTVSSISAMGSTASCDGWLCPIRGIGSGGYDPPSYTTSLDACATFEATITEKVEQANYAQEVIQAINDARHGEHRFIGASDFDRITAAPRQRCIAFLRMKGVL